ncbi:hypothetical protein H1C71_018443, partial [Ictidomys tridecemlineatus]
GGTKWGHLLEDGVGKASQGDINDKKASWDKHSGTRNRDGAALRQEHAQWLRNPKGGHRGWSQERQGHWKEMRSRVLLKRKKSALSLLLSHFMGHQGCCRPGRLPSPGESPTARPRAAAGDSGGKRILWKFPVRKGI